MPMKLRCASSAKPINMRIRQRAYKPAIGLSLKVSWPVVRHRRVVGFDAASPAAVQQDWPILFDVADAYNALRIARGTSVGRA
jgi:hypothetical protein